MIHELKCEKRYFDDCVEGRKTFEIREKRDRPFAVGDFLALNEVDATDNESTLQEINKSMVVWENNSTTFYYTGRCALFAVSYVLEDERFVKDGYCVLGLRPAQVGYDFENTTQFKHEPLYGAVVYDRNGPPKYTSCAY